MLMTFFKEEHEIFRKSFRDFVERELAPHAEEWEAAQEFPRDVFRRMGELGFPGGPTGLSWAAPTERDGTPQGLSTHRTPRQEHTRCPDK